MSTLPYKTFLIARTDNLGDVMLTLPLAGILKHHYPNARILFLGKSYTRALIERCKHVDTFIDRADLMQSTSSVIDLNVDVWIHVFPDKALSKIAALSGAHTIIGTAHRWFHWRYANKRVFFSRKKSNLHEAQLNTKLLQPLGLESTFSLSELYGFMGFEQASENRKPEILLHPKSKGSAREWPLNHYLALANILKSKGYTISITGTEAEGKAIAAACPGLLDPALSQNLTGEFSLDELIEYMRHCAGLVACSTGPLHIASALGLATVGIYPPIRPMHPGRWSPLGNTVEVLSKSKSCNDCRKNEPCACIAAIEVQSVLQALENLLTQKSPTVLLGN